MSDTPAPHTEERAGAAYAALAYGLWGVMPLYWRFLDGVPAFEITVHRVLWSALFVALITLARGHLPRVLEAMRNPRTLGTLALTGMLITGNWLLYIYCVETDQLVEASLGYYLTPLVSFALGFFFFAERLSVIRKLCIALASVALVLQVATLGHIPWIAPALAVSFGLYGYLRKKAPVAALDGLLVETALIFPVALGFVLWWASQAIGSFPSESAPTNILLILAGPVTAIPLSLFAAGARRIRMTTLGFLQYLAPSITLLMAVFGFGEPFTSVDFISFGCVWAALVIVALESRFARARPA